MKTSKLGIFSVLLLLLISITPTFAIEGLKISLQCTNVVLSWPSIDGKTYIVQYRQTMDPSTPWQVLTSSLPAASGTNLTFFVHSNIVQNPNCGGGGGSSFMSQSSITQLSLNESSFGTPSSTMTMAVDDAGTAVPFSLFPPGANLSGFSLIDPPLPEGSLSLTSGSSISLNGIELEGGGGGGGTTNLPPEVGFYMVVQNGVMLTSTTKTNLNGALADTLTVLFEAGNADSTGTNVFGILSSASLFVDGEKFTGATTVSSSTNQWSFEFDPAYLENGSHTIQVQTSWKNPDSTDNNHQYISKVSDSKSITVSNLVYYPDWEPEIGEAGISAYFLKTTCTDADWQIDIYDVSTNLVKTMTGHTTNGIIEAFWDMVDVNNVTRTNADVDPIFYSIATVADPIVKRLPPKKQRKSDWPAHGKWVTAYQDYFKFEYSANDAQQSSIDSFTLTGGQYGGYHIYYPPAGNTNDIGQTYPLRYQKANHPDPAITIDAMVKDYILLGVFLTDTNSRNFYYDGHGDNGWIGFLGQETIQKNVKHRYRFVFLNGCNTAGGSLDSAFGIKGPKRYDLSYYHKAGIRPGAFMGYSTEVNYALGGVVVHNGVTYDDTIPFQVPGFITNFLFYWDTYGLGLLSSIDSARSGLPPVGSQYREDFLKVHGYFNLHIDEFNRRTDTW